MSYISCEINPSFLIISLIDNVPYIPRMTPDDPRIIP